MIVFLQISQLALVLTDNCVLGSRGITVGKRAADDRLTGLWQEEKSFFVVSPMSSPLLLLFFQRFPLAVFFFIDTCINWRHLCHAQGDISIDPYTSIS